MKKDGMENSFTSLVRAYELSCINHEDIIETVQKLSEACVLSVLRKLYSVSGQEVMAELRYGILHDIDSFGKIHRINKCCSYSIDIPDNCREDKMTCEYIDETLIDLLRVPISDGYDLVNDAVVGILEETEKVRRRDGKLNEGFLEKSYTEHRLKNKVHIKNENSANGYETVETTPLKEVYKMIRRSACNLPAVQYSENKYVYMDDVTVDGEIKEAYFRPVSEYKSIACGEIDIAEMPNRYDTQVRQKMIILEKADDIDDIVKSLDLSERQFLVLKYRLDGYGYKAIATATGIDKNNVLRVCKQIRKKAIDYGAVSEIGFCRLQCG